MTFVIAFAALLVMLAGTKYHKVANWLIWIVGGVLLLGFVTVVTGLLAWMFEGPEIIRGWVLPEFSFVNTLLDAGNLGIIVFTMIPAILLEIVWLSIHFLITVPYFFPKIAVIYFIWSVFKIVNNIKK